MNIQQAKAIPLRALLAHLGRHPVKEVGDDLWYLSPLRSETAPSFKVNAERNIWYDFGEGAGGNILDFVMKISGVETSAAALIELAVMLQSSASPADVRPRPGAASQSRPSTTGSIPEDVLIRPLEHPALISYLRSRGLSAEIAHPYLKELHSMRQDKRYFSLAFKNVRGGYELRNAYFKGTHGPKDVSLISPAAVSDTMVVFEGFLDFLSALVCDLLPKPAPLVLVLNSNALRERASAVIREHGVMQVHLYLDHDPSGHDAVSYFRTKLAPIAVVDQSELYTGYKDLNDVLMAGTIRQLG